MRPRVLVNTAPSLDGKLAPARKNAPFVMSRHAEDPKRMLRLRAEADAVVVGAANLRAFDPALGGEVVVAHAATMPQATRKSLSTRATLVSLGETSVDVLLLLEWLG